MEATPANVQANELQPTRVAQLRVALGSDATITEADAMTQEFAPFDALIANPPFGMVTDYATKQSGEWPLGVTTTKEVDHAIAWRMLGKMPDDGRAVLILGGIKKQLVGDEQQKAYQERAKTSFFKQLYDTYNVVDHFTVAGQLYNRQGASWPVDVIVIDGRSASSRDYPMKTPPLVLSTWAEVGRKLNDAPDVDTSGRGPDPRGRDPASTGENDGEGVPQPTGGPDRPDDLGNTGAGPDAPAGNGGGTRGLVLAGLDPDQAAEAIVRDSEALVLATTALVEVWPVQATAQVDNPRKLAALAEVTLETFVMHLAPPTE